MSPWGYTSQKPKDFADQDGLSAAAVAAIKATHGMTYGHGAIATTIYPASGSSADFTYGSCGIKYSYGVELRDTGEGWFCKMSKLIGDPARRIQTFRADEAHMSLFLSHMNESRQAHLCKSSGIHCQS
jgi:hypothetical protein